MKVILIDSWTEHERGWGRRPDGYRAHSSEEARQKYNQAWREEFKHHADQCFPDNHVQQLRVSEEMFEAFLELIKNNKGLSQFGCWLDNIDEFWKMLEKLATEKQDPNVSWLTLGTDKEG